VAAAATVQPPRHDTAPAGPGLNDPQLRTRIECLEGKVRDLERQIASLVSAPPVQTVHVHVEPDPRLKHEMPMVQHDIDCLKRQISEVFNAIGKGRQAGAQRRYTGALSEARGAWTPMPTRYISRL